ncbi:helix-turn-helix domain-containing protein [Ruegeria sp.]|uniref:helix-turn-helix domain-containing protein n=1 Tax=Ruegeria sp. TaxID=1879320 RepID=UPI0023153881|nr:helix-turn-helix domain-containing protein [Ruegeria sp.]MDA7965039.1 helix-turn-helix domain-containing protein [Ruegeria sp.]
MKHYVLSKYSQELPEAAAVARIRTHHIDVILANGHAEPSVELIDEFYRALNDLIEDHAYRVKLHTLATMTAEGPSYWTGRTAIFWGDIYNAWSCTPPEKTRAVQVLRLAPRSVLVGGAVLLLAQIGWPDQTNAAIHPNFAAAAREGGLNGKMSGTHMAKDGRVHSASTRLSTLRLLAEFVSRDHGDHLADTLRGYIGLSETQSENQSQLATRLIQRSGADPVVRQAIEEMLRHIEEPLKITDLSSNLGTSIRQLQRRFLSKTGKRLLTTYRELRLERALSLLRYTDMSPREISAATGFSSPVAMRHSFRNHCGLSLEKIRAQRFTGAPPIN